MENYQRAGDRVRQWLDAHFDADGKSTIAANEVQFYIKAPYLLHTAGLHLKGARAVKFALEHFFDGDGMLTGAGALENRVYGMGWLLLGAVAVERLDLVGALIPRLKAMQDPHSGGVLLPDADAGEDVGEVCFSGGVGMALAAAGQTAAAQRMADRFVALLQAQPQSACYFNRFRRDGTVVDRAAAGDWEKMYDLHLGQQRPANFAIVILV